MVEDDTSEELLPEYSVEQFGPDDSFEEIPSDKAVSRRQESLHWSDKDNRVVADSPTTLALSDGEDIHKVADKVEQFSEENTGVKSSHTPEATDKNKILRSDAESGQNFGADKDAAAPIQEVTIATKPATLSPEEVSAFREEVTVSAKDVTVAAQGSRPVGDDHDQRQDVAMTTEKVALGSTMSIMAPVSLDNGDAARVYGDELTTVAWEDDHVGVTLHDHFEIEEDAEAGEGGEGGARVTHALYRHRRDAHTETTTTSGDTTTSGT
nr:hypothetical protein BaRGS_027733 [Batillaria attramentaria]